MNRRIIAIRGTLAAVDFAVIILSFAVASHLRFGAEWLPRWHALIPSVRWVIPLYAGIVVAAVAAAGLYRPRGRWSFKTELRDMAKMGATIVVLTLALLYAVKLEDVSRQFLVKFFVLTALGMLLSRAGTRWLLVMRRRRGMSHRRLLVVGSGAQARSFAADVSSRLELGIDVAGFVNNEGESPGHAPWLGTIADLPAVLADHVIDEVGICLPMDQNHLIDSVIADCREQGKDVRVPVRFMEGALAHAKLEQTSDLPVLSLLHTPSDTVGLALKRAVDMVGAALLIVATLPIMVVIAVAVKISDRGPVLFKQTRGGIHGREFSLLKFRTMVPNAEAMQHTIIDLNERTGPVFKVTNDPRITRVGKLLRRTSLDELPQLFNVLRGDMSLVGPRPAIPGEIAAYSSSQRRRLSVKPGITGLWQVTARADPNFDLWVKLDLDYIDNWSVWGDVKLLTRTPGALLRQPGS